MYNFSYFKCRFTRCELGIGGTPSLQGKGALVDILDADSREIDSLIFAHTQKQLVYYHEYAMPPQNGLFVVRAANNRVREYVGDHFEVITKADRPYVYVVIDTEPDEFSVEDMMLCFSIAKDNIARARISRLVKDHFVEKVGDYVENGTTKAIYQKTGKVMC